MGRYDIHLTQGLPWNQDFAYREGDETTVKPLTGATAKAQIRTMPGGPLISETQETVTANTGNVNVALTPVQTAAIPAGIYKWDLLVTLQSGEVIKFAQGDVYVVGSVTQQ